MNDDGISGAALYACLCQLAWCRNRSGACSLMRYVLVIGKIGTPSDVDSFAGNTHIHALTLPTRIHRLHPSRGQISTCAPWQARSMNRPYRNIHIKRNYTLFSCSALFSQNTFSLLAVTLLLSVLFCLSQSKWLSALICLTHNLCVRDVLVVDTFLLFLLRSERYLWRWTIDT